MAALSFDGVTMSKIPRENEIKDHLTISFAAFLSTFLRSLLPVLLSAFPG